MAQREKVVLVIEDDPEMILLLHLIFRDHAIRIVATCMGEECLAEAGTLQPDLVLLDLMLPGMDGWEIYQRMKRSPELREIPIIVVSARSETISRMNGQEFDSVASYVTKPFEPRSLVSLVEHCLTNTYRHGAEWAP